MPLSLSSENLFLHTRSENSKKSNDSDRECNLEHQDVVWLCILRQAVCMCDSGASFWVSLWLYCKHRCCTSVRMLLFLFCWVKCSTCSHDDASTQEKSRYISMFLRCCSKHSFCGYVPWFTSREASKKIRKFVKKAFGVSCFSF